MVNTAYFFKQIDRQVFKNQSLMINTLHFPNKNFKSGDNKNFVAIIVANVVTERIRLDTTALYRYKIEKFDMKLFKI
jgi:hypothetical protein